MSETTYLDDSGEVGEVWEGERMPYGRDVGFSYFQLVRDVTFLLHESAAYGHIYGDNDYWSLLSGPYYEFFEEGESAEDIQYFRSRYPEAFQSHNDVQEPPRCADEFDLFAQMGSVLLFYSMLVDWEQSSGYAFGAYQGGRRHPLPAYVERLLRAYRRVRLVPEHPTRPLYVATLTFLGVLDRPHSYDPSGPTKLDKGLQNSKLLTELRELLIEDSLKATKEQLAQVDHAIYEQYVLGYFRDRAQSGGYAVDTSPTP